MTYFYTFCLLTNNTNDEFFSIYMIIMHDYSEIVLIIENTSECIAVSVEMNTLNPNTKSWQHHV